MYNGGLRPTLRLFTRVLALAVGPATLEIVAGISQLSPC